jgi:penicillin amidase
MKRWILRLLAGAVLACAIVFVIGWLTLRASLPKLDGDVPAHHLTATVTVERDASGIPTITASSRADLAYGTGFVHGQDRFFQMDLIRRQGAGQLSELFGEAALDTDRFYRFHRFRSRAQTVLAALPDDELELLEKYVAGVNAGLASLTAKPFEYFLIGTDPEPWRIEDSLLGVYVMFVRLNDSMAIKDVQRGYAHRVLPGAVYDWMYQQGTSWDAPIVGDARETLAAPAADVYSIRDIVEESPPANERGRPPFDGSNNWAVGGELTSTGRALVSNDMHLGLSVPNIYYQARLIVDAEQQLDIMGVTLPSAPLVIAGSNGKVAWGFTNSYGDWSDAVVLRQGEAPETYKTPDGDLPFDVHLEVIAVKDGDPVEMEIRETIWGPVNDNLDYPDGAVAVSWTGHRDGALNLNLLRLETAESVQSALDIAKTLGMPPQNFVVGDADGNIGWTIAGKIPIKSDFNPMVPADWSETHGWLGWLDGADYPQVVNPAIGRIWSANARVVDGEALAVVGDGGYDLGARAQQIRDRLFEKEQFEPSDMLAIQYDDRALLLTRWRELLLDLLDDDALAADERLVEYRRLIDDWIPRAAPDSVGYRLVRSFRLEVRARVFHALMGPVRDAYENAVELRLSNQFEGPLWMLLTEQPDHLLPGRFDSWRELMLDAVRQNIEYFEATFEGPIGKRSWGERNTASIRHPLSRAVPVLSRLLDMPREPLNGDVNVPKAQGRSFGAAERFSVAPGDEANGLMHMPGGQSGHPLSRFYRAGHDDWVQGRASPFLPGKTQHKLTLTPVRD